VIGHEMSHIKNYDVRLLLIVSTLIGMAGLLASLIWRSALFMRGGRGRQWRTAHVDRLRGRAPHGHRRADLRAHCATRLSRRRESLADVSGVELTRNPVGLISALKKLQSNDQPFAKFNHATAAMCIDDPLQHHEKWFHHLFDTHPPIAERIATLEQISVGSELKPRRPSRATHRKLVVRQVVGEGHAARVLIAAAAHADLLVVGCRHGAFTGIMLGSVSLHCVARASCAVVIATGPLRRSGRGDTRSDRCTGAPGILGVS
jgi:nucleotide-binding universal stress UspA family protein